ncbi:MAG: hypothetical protein ACYC7D_12755 [Nitrososphaerales archaeon]
MTGSSCGPSSGCVADVVSTGIAGFGAVVATATAPAALGMSVVVFLLLTGYSLGVYGATQSCSGSNYTL